MEIKKMTLEQWREELQYQYNMDRLYDPICEHIRDYLNESRLSLSSSVLAAQFKVSPQKMNLLLKCLVMMGEVACDPSVVRYRLYWIDPSYKAKTQQAQPDQVKEEISAQEGVLNLQPTTLAKEDKKGVEREIRRLQCFLEVDKLNKDHANNLLISFDQSHIMIQYAPTKDQYAKIRTFLQYINLFPLDDNNE